MGLCCASGELRVYSWPLLPLSPWDLAALEHCQEVMAGRRMLCTALKNRKPLPLSYCLRIIFFSLEECHSL